MNIIKNFIIPEENYYNYLFLSHLVFLFGCFTKNILTIINQHPFKYSIIDKFFSQV